MANTEQANKNAYKEYILAQPITYSAEESADLEVLREEDPDKYLIEKEVIDKVHRDRREGAMLEIEAKSQQSRQAVKYLDFKQKTGVELTGEVLAQIPPVWLEKFNTGAITTEELAGKLGKLGNGLEEHNPLQGFQAPNLSTAGGGGVPPKDVKFDEAFYASTIM